MPFLWKSEQHFQSFLQNLVLVYFQILLFVDDRVVEIKFKLFQLILRVYLVEEVQVLFLLFWFFVFLLNHLLEDVRLLEDFSLDEVVHHGPCHMRPLFLHLIFLYLFLQLLHLLLLLRQLALQNRIFILRKVNLDSLVWLYDHTRW